MHVLALAGARANFSTGREDLGRNSRDLKRFEDRFPAARYLVGRLSFEIRALAKQIEILATTSSL